VWRAAFRIAAGELKDRRRFRGTASDAAYEMEEPPWRLIAGLARLSPNQRAALVLHYYAGYPTKDIAGILGSSAATVRVHLSQGRKRLRRILEEQDD
jgi:RNA polymerase sigma factor (sigma-70 family)